MQILETYKAILASMGVHPDADGLLSFYYNDDVTPIKIDDLRLTLPSPARLSSGDWHNLIAFHPLSENLVRGESPVLRKFKMIINVRLTSILADLLHQFTETAADTARHKTLSPKEQEMLSHLSEVDEKSLEAFDKIISTLSPDGSCRIINVFLKRRGGVYKGEKVARKAVVTFPILSEFDNGDNTVYGVKLRKKDFAALESLLRYIVPDGDDIDAYSGAAGTSMFAPYFDSLLKAYINVAKRLNDVIDIHRKHLDNADSLYTDLSWVPKVADLTIYRNAIPALPGNEGDIDEPPPEAAPVATPAGYAASNRPAIPTARLADGPRAIAPTQQSRYPQAAAPTTPKRGKGGLSFSEVMQARNVNMAAPPPYGGYPPDPAAYYGHPSAPPYGGYPAQYGGYPPPGHYPPPPTRGGRPIHGHGYPQPAPPQPQPGWMGPMGNQVAYGVMAPAVQAPYGGQQFPGQPPQFSRPGNIGAMPVTGGPRRGSF